MAADWSDTLRYIKEELPDAHLWYSEEFGWCYITDRKGQRHRIDKTMKGWQVAQEIERIKSRIAVLKSNGSTTRHFSEQVR